MLLDGNPVIDHCLSGEITIISLLGFILITESDFVSSVKGFSVSFTINSTVGWVLIPGPPRWFIYTCPFHVCASNVEFINYNKQKVQSGRRWTAVYHIMQTYLPARRFIFRINRNSSSSRTTARKLTDEDGEVE